MAAENHKTMSLLILTLILANVKKRIGPNFFQNVPSYDRSDPSVCVSVIAVIRR